MAKAQNYLISSSASCTSSAFMTVTSSSPLHPTFSNSSSSRLFTLPFSKSSIKERKLFVVQQCNSTRIELHGSTFRMLRAASSTKTVSNTFLTTSPINSTLSINGLPETLMITLYSDRPSCVLVNLETATSNSSCCCPGAPDSGWEKEKLYLNRSQSPLAVHLSFN